MKDAIGVAVFLVALSASQLIDAYVDRVRRTDCHDAGGRMVHVDGHGCRFGHDVCEEPKK
jgi:hypothetical protein